MAQEKPDCILLLKFPYSKNEYRIRIYKRLWRKITIKVLKPDGSKNVNNGDGTVSKLLRRLAAILKKELYGVKK